MPSIISDPTLNVDLPSTQVKWATAQAASAHDHRDMARHVPHLSLRESPPPRLSFRTARRHTWTNTKEPTSARHARASSCGLLESLHDAGAFAQLKTSDASHRSDAQRPRGYIGPLFMLGRVRGWSPWRIGRCGIAYSLPVTTPFSDTGATKRPSRSPIRHSSSRSWGVAVRTRRTVTVSHGMQSRRSELHRQRTSAQPATRACSSPRDRLESPCAPALFCTFRASTPWSYGERVAVVVSSRAEVGFDFLALPIRRDRFKRAFESFVRISF